MRELFGGGLELERLGQKARRRDQFADQRRLGRFIDRAARSSETNRQRRQDGELAGESLSSPRRRWSASQKAVRLE
jgi:hypothetical protein